MYIFAMTPISNSRLSPLQTRIARQIVSHVRREDKKTGDHLVENHLATLLGTSRSPVQIVLKFLVGQGLLQHDPNRGYFLIRDAKEWTSLAHNFATQPDDPLYWALAEARHTGQLPDEINEADLMRRFKVARSTLRKVLARIREEGWAEPRVGHGWCFQTMIESPEAYEESYLFRQTIEPSGILSPSFCARPDELQQLLQEQRMIVEDGFKHMSPFELFETNCRFHEKLAEWSGNRFIVQAVKRINQLRRLVEYRQAAIREARQLQAKEHIQILNAIAIHDFVSAAALLRSHLDGARRAKVNGKDIFD